MLSACASGSPATASPTLPAIASTADSATPGSPTAAAGLGNQIGPPPESASPATSASASPEASVTAGAGVSPAATGGPSATIAEAQLARTVDEQTKGPLERTIKFNGNEPMHVAARIGSAKQGTKFVARWAKGSDRFLETTYEADRDLADVWLDFSATPAAPLPAGTDYRVDLLVNGRVEKSLSFQVQA